MSKRSSKRRIKEGFVTSEKMNKTRVVRVENFTKHSRYGRVMKQASSFKVHDEKNQAKLGDKVRIMQTRPLSKDKRWRLLEVLK